jgi:putative transcriptional regulator
MGGSAPTNPLAALARTLETPVQIQDPPDFPDHQRSEQETCDAEERALVEAMLAATEGLPPVDAGRGAARLAGAVAELPLRYAPFFARLSELWQLPEPKLVRELSRARDARAWSRSLLPGLRTFELALDQSEGRGRLLRFSPGARFPRHRHRGTEQLLVLEGAFADADGEVRAGDGQTMPPDSEHELIILGDVPCVAAVMERGIELTQGWLRLVNRFLR